MSEILFMSRENTYSTEFMEGTLKEQLEFARLSGTIEDYVESQSGCNALQQSEEGRRVKSAMDSFFVFFFLNDELKKAMPQVVSEVLNRYGGEVPELYKEKEEWESEVRERGYTYGIEYRILNLIHEKATAGDKYCLWLIRLLYKTFHKEEYKVLKRYSSISMRELLELSKDGEKDRDDIFFCAYGMCPILGITIRDDLKGFYDYLEQKDSDQPMARRVKEIMPEDKMLKYREIIWDMMDEEQEKAAPYLPWLCVIVFVQRAMYYLGMQEVHDLFYKEKDPEEQEELFIETLALLMFSQDKQEFTFEEIQMYAVYYLLLKIMIASSVDILRHVSMLLRIDIDPDMAVPVTTYDLTYEEEKQENVSEAPKQEEPAIDPTKELLCEIERLKKKVKGLEAEKKELWEDRKKVKSLEKKLSDIQKNNEDERAELIALRDFTYGLSEHFQEAKKASMQEMIRALKNRRILIIGGHINWHNKIREVFPMWKLVAPGASQMINTKIFDGIEKVYFFTDCISHSTYQRYISELRSRKIRFGYLHQVNMEQMITSLYSEII